MESEAAIMGRLSDVVHAGFSVNIIIFLLFFNVLYNTIVLDYWRRILRHHRTTSRAYRQVG